MAKVRPVLTIIIPHYNTPEMLETLLESIPERNEIQIIVVDDNSTKKADFLTDEMAERSLPLVPSMVLSLVVVII